MTIRELLATLPSSCMIRIEVTGEDTNIVGKVGGRKDNAKISCVAHDVMGAVAYSVTPLWKSMELYVKCVRMVE